MTAVRPMLAAKVDVEQLGKLVYPMSLQPKLDGIRTLIIDGRAYSRSGKLIPNQHVQKFVFDNRRDLDGMDGELIVGDPTAKDCYPRTSSGIMSHGGKPDFTFWVFDYWDAHAPYEWRRKALQGRFTSLAGFPVIEVCKLTPEKIVTNAADVEETFGKLLAEGHEGAILRGLTKAYKRGRSTLREGILLKLKDFVDAEATVIGFGELMRNGNEATQSELGYTVRSSHQDNLIAANCLGFLQVKMLGQQYAEFCIGTGFDQSTRDRLWDERGSLIGRVVKFKYMPSGSKDRPRHPVFLGFRDPADMS